MYAVTTALAQGLDPRMWVPDVQVPEFGREAERQSALVAASGGAEDEQALVDDLADCDVP